MRCSGNLLYETEKGICNKLSGDINLAEKSLKSIDFKGKIKFDVLKSDIVILKGKVSGDEIIAEDVELSGKLFIKKICANNVRIKFESTSTIGEVVAKNKVKISKRGELKIDGLDINIGQFHLSIKGNNKIGMDDVQPIQIDSVVADIVDADGCIINQVECRKLTAKNCVIRSLSAETQDIINSKID